MSVHFGARGMHCSGARLGHTPLSIQVQGGADGRGWGVSYPQAGGGKGACLVGRPLSRIRPRIFPRPQVPIPRRLAGGVPFLPRITPE